MILVDQMKNLKIYRRPMYLPTVDGDKKKGSAALLLTPNYESSRKLIANPLFINKKRFESYYLDPNVTYYIKGKTAKGKDKDDYINEMSILEMYHGLCEMTAEERKKIKDSDFGLSDKRKYPLDSPAHVRSAIKFFNYVSEEDEEELARNIKKAINKFFPNKKPNIGKDNRLSKYITEVVNEAGAPVFVSVENFEFNLDKLKPSSRNNILYITGYCGAGKSTTTKAIMSKYPNAEELSMDHFSRALTHYQKEYWNNPEIVSHNRLAFEWFNLNKDRILSNLVGKKLAFESKEFPAIYVEFFNWLEQRTQQPDCKGKIFIVEGTQILKVDAEFFEGKPLIIMGTSAFTSWYRKQKRDVLDIEILKKKPKKLKTLFTSMALYFKIHKEMNDFLDTLDEAWNLSIVNEAATKDDDGLIKNPAIEETTGFMDPKERRWNAIVKLKHQKERFRARSEVLVLSKDHTKVYLYMKDKDSEDKVKYNIPGGSWDENEDHMFCAIRETREEALMEITNVKYLGSYAYIADKMHPWVEKNVPENLQWKGYYTELYVAEYNGSYDGPVAKVDQDKKMADNGKFYPIGSMKDTLTETHYNAIQKYLKENNIKYKKGIKMSHIIASGIIRDSEGKILTEMHKKANGLVLPSGKASHIDEAPIDILKREIYEELGVIVERATLNHHYSYKAEYPVGSGEWVIFEEYNYFIDKIKEGIIENKEPDKHTELLWLTEEELIDDSYHKAAELEKYLIIYENEQNKPANLYHNSLSQFMFFSGYREDVNEVTKILNPDVYFDMMVRECEVPIRSVTDIPLLKVCIESELSDPKDYYHMVDDSREFTILELHVGPCNCSTRLYIDSLHSELRGALVEAFGGPIESYGDLSLIESIQKSLSTKGIIKEETIIPEYLSEDQYLEIGNTITLFEGATEDTKLRELLYAERIKQRGQLMPILNRAKEDIPDIKYTYPDIARFKQKNVFVDLYYYNELFFKNNNWEKDKGYKLYLQLLDRLINNPEIDRAGYKLKTLFIPVLDWNKNRSAKMWMYKETINPVSIIFNLMKTFPEDVKKIFGKMNIFFIGNDKYFKLNFSEMEEPAKDSIKFSSFIRKLLAGEEFDPEDIDTSLDMGSKEQRTADIVDKIEDAKGVDITKNLSQVKKRNEEISKDYKSYKDSSKPSKGQNKTDQDTLSSLQAEEKEKDINRTKSADSSKLQQVEDDINYMADAIEDAVENAEDVEDALEKLNSDDEFKEILASINAMGGDDIVKVDATRAARMNKLDADFLASNIGERTVKDILDSKEANAKLETVSLPISSPNEQWKEMTYMNFDKDYDLERDIVSCFYHFTKVSKPISIRSLKAVDNSTSEDNLILYTCEMEDFKGTRFTVKLDIPKMVGNRLRLRGNDKSIQNQLFNMPIIKTETDTCQIVTNYQKIFIRTYNTVTGRSLPMTGKFIKAIKKYEGNKIKVIYGENSKVCDKYEVPIDYQDISTIISIIESKRFKFYFNQDEIRQEYPKTDDSKGLPIGIDKSSNQIIYYVMKNSSFTDILLSYLQLDEPKIVELYKENKPSTSGVYSRCSILNTQIPLVILCAYAEGLTSTLDKAKVNWKLQEKLDIETKQQITNGFKSSIKFEDGYLIYENSYPACMLLNGLDVSGMDRFSMMEIDNKNTYLEILDMYGGRIKSDGLDNFYDCLVDPITYETLEYYNLPTDYVGILLYANILLCDNKYIAHGDMSSRRVRRTEQIAAYTYEALSESYAVYANMIKHSRTKPTMAIKQSAVIDKILASPISSDDSTINALEAVETTNAFTARGKAGMNEQRSYTLDKRTYDDSMLNVLGMSTAYSAGVSITRQGTMNMSIDTARGYIKPINGNTEKMNAANTLAAVEALTPFGSTRDDAPRTLMTFAQTAQHQVRTEESDPLLVTNGADEALAYLTTDKFAYKAKQNGKVLELTDDYMIIEYKNGKKEYIDLSETMQKNSNGGFYVPLKLDPIPKLKVGSAIKENEIIAYDKKSFSNSVGESDNIAYNIGKLVKVAILNTSEGYEDSGICVQSLAESLSTTVIDKEDHTIDKDSNVFFIAKVGDPVEPEDPLLIWSNPHEEEEANTLLRIMGDDQEMVNELGRKTVKSEISGRVADIKIYRTVEIDELSPSLQKIVKDYESKIKKTKKKMDEYGINSNSLPATYKLEPTGKLKKAQDAVFIEFYLERKDIISVGDKLTYYSANKAIIKTIVPDELAPYTDSRPNEPVGAFIADVSIDKRMVTSTPNYGALQKLMIETDRTIKDMLGIPYDDSKV